MENREMDIINVLDEENEVTQRDIAKRTGMSLGMVNTLIKKLVKKGLVKIERLNSRNLRYILTPKGIQDLGFSYFKNILRIKFFMGGGDLLSHIIYYGLGGLIRAGAALGFTAIFTRIFLPGDFGYYNLIKSIVLLITLLLTEWLKQAINRYLPSTTDEKGKKIVKEAVVLYILLLSVIFLFLGFICLFFVKINDFFLLALLFVWSFAIYQLLLQIFVSEIKSNMHTIARITQSVGRLVLALGLVLLINKNIKFLLWGDILASFLIIPFIGKKLGIGFSYKLIERLPILKNELMKYLKYGLPMMGWFAAYTLLAVGDRYIIQLFRGSAEVGIYSANYSLIAGGVELVISPFLLFAHPYLVKAWSNNSNKFVQKKISEISDWFIYCSVLFISLLVLISKPLAGLLLGTEYRQGYWIIPVVATGILIWNLSMYGHKPLEFKEKTGLMMIGGLSAALINLTLNILFVPYFGYSAAAWTTLVSYFSYLIFVYISSKKHLPWQIPWKRVFRKTIFVFIALSLIFVLKRFIADLTYYLLSVIIIMVLAVMIPLRLEGITLKGISSYIRRELK